MPDLFNGKSRSRSASSVRPARSQESVPSAPQPTSRFQMGTLLSGILVPPFHPVRRPGNTPLERTRRFIICCSAARDCCNALLGRFLPRLGPWATTALFLFFCQWLVDCCQVAVTRLVNRPFTRRQWAAAVAGPIPSFPSIGALIPLWSWPPLGKERMWPAAVAAEPAHAGRCQCRLCEEGLSGVAP